jgi:hypothetical protein
VKWLGLEVEILIGDLGILIFTVKGFGNHRSEREEEREFS